VAPSSCNRSRNNTFFSPSATKPTTKDAQDSVGWIIAVWYSCGRRRRRRWLKGGQLRWGGEKERGLEAMRMFPCPQPLFNPFPRPLLSQDCFRVSQTFAALGSSGLLLLSSIDFSCYPSSQQQLSPPRAATAVSISSRTLVCHLQMHGVPVVSTIISPSELSPSPHPRFEL
jgi:hypothetical protein